MHDMSVPEETAKQMIREWHAAFPGVDAFAQRLKRECRERKGVVQTLGGRKRYLPALAGADETKRREAERQVVNTMCQGSAADLIKRAMVTIDRMLLPDGKALHTPVPGRLLLQIHARRAARTCPAPARVRSRRCCERVAPWQDELLFEVAETHAPELRRAVREAMVGALELKVPLQVKLMQGPSWGTLEVMDEEGA